MNFTDHPAAFAIGLAVALAFGLIIVSAILRKFLYISRPHVALIVSGGSTRLADGTMVGYEVVAHGHSKIVIPVLNEVRMMDMRLIPIDVVVNNALSKGKIPLRIHAVANVKVSSDPQIIHNAIERFQDQPVVKIQDTARETLGGALREVLATMTPEEVNEDRLKFAEMLSRAAASDMAKLGLELDTLKIIHITDETGYLDSLGRPLIASALRDAENAENQAMQETAQAQSLASQRAEVARAQGEMLTQQKTNELRRITAELDGNAEAVEREATAAAQTARAEAEKDLQTLRAELEQKRLQADVVIPADSHRQAQVLIARGEAAPVLENGAAAVEVLRAMAEAWKDMGAQATEIYVIQHLDQIMGTVLDRIGEMQIREVNVIDNGDGKSLAAYAASYPQMVGAVMRALKETTGVDVPAIVNREHKGGA